VLIENLIVFVVGFLIFVAVGTMYLFFPEQILRWVALMLRFNYMLIYRDFNKVPEPMRGKIKVGLECPEDASFTMCLYRCVGVFFFVVALLILAFLVLPTIRQLCSQ
jgi:hypothetical protein